jgi:hypothetical protein
MGDEDGADDGADDDEDGDDDVGDGDEDGDDGVTEPPSGSLTGPPQAVRSRAARSGVDAAHTPAPRRARRPVVVPTPSTSSLSGDAGGPAPVPRRVVTNR